MKPSFCINAELRTRPTQVLHYVYSNVWHMSSLSVGHMLASSTYSCSLLNIIFLSSSSSLITLNEYLNDLNLRDRKRMSKARGFKLESNLFSNLNIFKKLGWLGRFFFLSFSFEVVFVVVVKKKKKNWRLAPEFFTIIFPSNCLPALPSKFVFLGIWSVGEVLVQWFVQKLLVHQPKALLSTFDITCYASCDFQWFFFVIFIMESSPVQYYLILN